MTVISEIAGSMPATMAEACRQLAGMFREAGLETPALDARMLVTGALGLDAAAAIHTPEHRITPLAATKIAGFAERRLAREPVSRILGRRQFYGLDFTINAGTLDPRPDTETLVEAALGLVRNGEVPGGLSPRILDLGTGSGAILIALLMALPAAHGVGTDIDARALDAAAKNAWTHGVTGRIELQRSDWLGNVSGRFDLIVSNPPYIPQGEIDALEPEVAVHDPRAALDGGADGLDAYRAILGGVGGLLTPGGWFAFEIGHGQENEICKIITECGKFDLQVGMKQWPDLSSCTRCVAVRALNVS